MTSAPKRRWLRFSLGTMLVVVTVCACVVGWLVHSIRWIRLRHEWMDAPPTVYLHINKTRRAPWPLVPFGERGWEIISMRFCPWTLPEPVLTEEEKAEYRRVKELFPEAIISTSPLDSRRPRLLRKFP